MRKLGSAAGLPDVLPGGLESVNVERVDRRGRTLKRKRNRFIGGLGDDRPRDVRQSVAGEDLERVAVGQDDQVLPAVTEGRGNFVIADGQLLTCSVEAD